MHTLGGSQELSAQRSVLLHSQSHRPGPKIFMMGMTQRNGDLRWLLAQQNPELHAE